MSPRLGFVPMRVEAGRVFFGVLEVFLGSFARPNQVHNLPSFFRTAEFGFFQQLTEYLLFALEELLRFVLVSFPWVTRPFTSLCSAKTASNFSPFSFLVGFSIDYFENFPSFLCPLLFAALF